MKVNCADGTFPPNTLRLSLMSPRLGPCDRYVTSKMYASITSILNDFSR